MSYWLRMTATGNSSRTCPSNRSWYCRPLPRSALYEINPLSTNMRFIRSEDAFSFV